MRTPEEYEAEIDRLSAALDLEAKARQSMADMAFDLSVELREAKAKAEQDAKDRAAREAVEAAERRDADAKAAAEHDLRWYAAEHAIRSAKLPSVRDLAARWGWTRSRAYDLLTNEAAWRDASRPWSWREADPSGDADIRTPAGQSPDTIRTHARSLSDHPTPNTLHP